MASFNFVCHSINKPRKKHQTSNPVKDNEPRKKKKKKTTNPKKTHSQTDKQPTPIQPCFLIFFFFFFLWVWDEGKKKSCTEWQVWEPQTVWKILSDGKWVMVSNECGILKWWVISEEWWVMSDEWWVTEIKWWKKVIQTASKGSNDSLKWQSLESSLVKC